MDHREEGRQVTPRLHITLNRALRAAWLYEALRLSAEGLPTSDAMTKLEGMLARDVSGKESVRKSLRYLRQVWLEPREELTYLRDNGISLYRRSPSEDTARTLSFYMLLATYPFFREVAEVCGKLHRLQGSVKSEQIKRKIAGYYGEKEPVTRSTRYAISLLADLGVLEGQSIRGIYKPGKESRMDAGMAAFALAALMDSLSVEHGISRSRLEQQPCLFAFDAHQLVMLALRDSRFSISRESLNKEIVTLNEGSRKH